MLLALFTHESVISSRFACAVLICVNDEDIGTSEPSGCLFSWIGPEHSLSNLKPAKNHWHSQCFPASCMSCKLYELTAAVRAALNAAFCTGQGKWCVLMGECEAGQRTVGGEELLHKNNLQSMKGCLCAQESKRGRKELEFSFYPSTE